MVAVSLKKKFQILYGSGIYHNAEIIDLGVQIRLVDKSGAWYAYKGDKIGQGQANAAKYMAAHQAVADEIEKAIRDQLLPKPSNAKAAAVEASTDADL